VEVRYDDRRYFFTEGLDLFNKDDLFYSRRVGGAPINFYTPVGSYSRDSIIANPATTKLYNATKISGRTKHNLGIGFFNAIAGPEYVTVVDSNGRQRQCQTGPLTNYNVMVLDQALKNNSYLSVINTNVWRQENSYNADVTGLIFRFANKANFYSFSGSGDMSQLYYGSKPDVGYRYALNYGKISGNYNWTISTKTISDRFNPNDLGYLDRNNYSYYIFDQYYNIYKPVGNIVSAYNHVGINYYRIFNPNVFQQADIFGSHNVTFPNYLTIGFYWTLQHLLITIMSSPVFLAGIARYLETIWPAAFIPQIIAKGLRWTCNLPIALTTNRVGMHFLGRYRRAIDSLIIFQSSTVFPVSTTARI
jgi:hypothetical protein